MTITAITQQSRAELPAEKGSYGLVLRLNHPCPLTIGRLGSFIFPPGIYIYCGSALGAGGIRARLGRHLCTSTAYPRWHIDYLRAKAEVVTWFYQMGEVAMECAWSQRLARLPNARIPLSGFGSSDCRAGCAAHLVSYPDEDHLAAIFLALSQDNQLVWLAGRE